VINIFREIILLLKKRKDKKIIQILFKINNFLKKLFIYFKGIYLFFRIQKPITLLFGPVFKRSYKFIEIDITYVCNVNCISCNRSCEQAPSKDHLTISQIKKFIDESIKNAIMWERIRILGGEPTLHKDIFTILNMLIEYKKKYSPNTILALHTNGFGKKVNEVLKQIPEEVKIVNSSKKSSSNPFFSFNIAPIDLFHYKFADFSVGCRVIEDCGIGLTPYGYYACAVAGGIDRILGFDIGRKKIPSQDDLMWDQLKVFCKYCGNFRRGGYNKVFNKLVSRNRFSKTWDKAYKKYKEKKSKLTLY
jgi:hypothetical protein